MLIDIDHYRDAPVNEAFLAELRKGRVFYLFCGICPEASKCDMVGYQPVMEFDNILVRPLNHFLVLSKPECLHEHVTSEGC